MTFFLDTCVIIDVLRSDKPHVRQRLSEAEAAERKIVISAMVLHELVYGALISADPSGQLAQIDQVMLGVEVEPWSAEDAISTARLRADMKVAGSPLKAIDGLIAGQALSRGWSIVTNNIKDFIRIPGLTIIDWSDPAGAQELSRAAMTAQWAPAQPRRSPKEPK